MTEKDPKGLTRLRRPHGRIADKEASYWRAGRNEMSGQPCGFGFVEMPNKEEADKAIAGLRCGASPARHFRVVSLGLRLRDRDAAIRYLKNGLPISSFRGLGAGLDMTDAQLASVARVALRTIARRKKAGRLGFGESERIFRLGVLFDAAVRVFGGVEAARRWLKAPQKGLGGRTPLEYSDTAIGVREVEDLLGRLEHGVFS